MFFLNLPSAYDSNNPLPSHFSIRCLQEVFAIKSVHVIQGIGLCLLGDFKISSAILPNGKDKERRKVSAPKVADTVIFRKS